jgi:acetyl-CoA/propionyl-CoA carboxylase biotin carboxyl carrier protein
MRQVRQRLSVPAAQLVVQPAPDEVEAYAPASFGELVTPLPQTADDRATGRTRFEVVVDGWRFEVTAEAAARAELRDRAMRVGDDQRSSADSTLRAQIPGRVARVWVSDGDQVEQGQRLLAVEAMKMENEIRAPHAGTVRDLRVEPGARVERNDDLLTVAH